MNLSKGWKRGIQTDFSWKNLRVSRPFRYINEQRQRCLCLLNQTPRLPSLCFLYWSMDRSDLYWSDLQHHSAPQKFCDRNELGCCPPSGFPRPQKKGEYELCKERKSDTETGQGPRCYLLLWP